MRIPKTQRKVGIHQLSIGKPKKLGTKIPMPKFPKLPKLPTTHTNKSKY